MTYATTSILARCTAQCRIASPLGTLLLARTHAGLAGAWFEMQKHHPDAIDAPERDDDPLLTATASQLGAYFAGERSGFDIPLDLQGTTFQRDVWQVLLGIEAGATRSYGEIARELGLPSASRAVGSAVGRNPVSIIVPCHRVVGSSGALTGYAGGLDRKTSLLRIEADRRRSRHGAQQLELH
ncbi:MAG: methylated-DNA--[protein]-cysteine S-methyltransferase [Caldimonas sp.]